MVYGRKTGPVQRCKGSRGSSSVSIPRVYQGSSPTMQSSSYLPPEKQDDRDNADRDANNFLTSGKISIGRAGGILPQNLIADKYGYKNEDDPGCSWQSLPED